MKVGISQFQISELNFSAIWLITDALVYDIDDSWPTGLFVIVTKPLLVQDLEEFKPVTSRKTFSDLKPDREAICLVIKF